MVAIFCPHAYPRPRGWGKKVKLYLFLKVSHVAYQIKADDAGSNTVANILPTDTPSIQGVGKEFCYRLFKIAAPPNGELISYHISISKQSRPRSGSFYKSVERHLYEVKG